MVNVTPAPDLGFSPLQWTGFSQGQTGATVTATTVNLTGGTTAGQVALTYTLPTGFSGTALSGTGWSCNLNSLTCTRSDTLGPFGSYPPVTLTMNIAVNAPPSIRLDVTVSGGGEVNTFNDTSSIFGTLGAAVTINPTINSATVNPGGTGNFAFNAFSVVTGTVNFSCNGLPLGTTCTFSPTSMTQGQVPLALAIKTSGPGPSTFASTRRSGPPPAVWLFSILGVAGMIRLKMKRKGRGRKALPILAVARAAAFLWLAGCGGGGGIQNPPPVVTPSGTYTITVVGDNPSVNAQGTTKVTLIVR